ncbi:hypothetical protein HanXRQr2_Chr13g0587821 [Helianthus annuus]|uniref:Uncharacterized protein n=1 Tax=Helianthus annuus TaxID=4232 RepID=A0A251SRZ3_HELAN|nr:hypothetical protein HanXRQr2_Chr13g0587821 [Helianthus annuus]KAJ0849185.1 hypothetical protein HanPSC8_Chr13g0565991 [Helianthus annuus]
MCVPGSRSIEQRQRKGETLVSLISSNWEEISRKLGCMHLNVDHLSDSNTKIGTTLVWTKHGRLTGQDEARKRLRTRRHKVVQNTGDYHEE